MTKPLFQSSEDIHDSVAKYFVMKVIDTQKIINRKRYIQSYERKNYKVLFFSTVSVE